MEGSDTIAVPSRTSSRMVQDSISVRIAAL